MLTALQDGTLYPVLWVSGRTLMSFGIMDYEGRILETQKLQECLAV